MGGVFGTYLESYQPFDFNGHTYKARGVVSEPKPVQTPRPLLMSAGFSPAGQDFAQNYADMNFIAMQDLAQAREAAAKVRHAARVKYGRDVLVCVAAGSFAARPGRKPKISSIMSFASTATG
jgi:alkanesulfonate monooxygenase SsuD/methylene tetrahydromethanopterin reductase-like flavin-dependent oxidoreductase (luciferase family)